MSVSASTTAALDDRVSQLLDRWASPIYPVAVAVGLLAQLVALPLRSVWLAAAGMVLAGLVEVATTRERHPLRQRLRQGGLGHLQRTTLRAVVFVAALAVADAAVLVPAVVAVQVLALAAAARVLQLAVTRVLETEPAIGARNLGDGLDLRTFYGRARRRRGLGVSVICAVEVPIALLAALGASGILGPVAFLLLAALVTVAVVGLAAAAWAWSRRFRRSGRVEAYLEALRAAIRASGAEVVLYFSGGADATYQLDQWLGVLDRLERTVLIVLRERGHLLRMGATRQPVLYCRRALDVEVALAADPKVALYVGNAGRNIHFLRYPRLKHVFLNHGDSDKVSSANRFVEVYDRLFVAGEIAVERYRAAGIDLDDDQFALVGRPQLDRVLDDRRRRGAGPTTVLYAPTWEGYFAAADYTSLGRMGEQLVRRLLSEHPELRIVFKPHPMSGVVRRQEGVAARRVAALLREAGGPHVVADDHPELDLLDWFDRTDVLIADVSAVVTDFLHTDKPYLVTNPRGLPIEEFHERFPSHTAGYVLDPELEALEPRLRDALGEDPLGGQRARLKRAVLGEHPEGPQRSFERALEEMVVAAERDAARVRNTFSYDA